ncbi:MAG: histidine kinase [Calothrix sp. CSU_2_0]|nr:histidine kinase [Calothrix sp. CSU_2_0]
MLRNIGKFPSIKFENYRLIFFISVVAFSGSFLITYLSPNSKPTGWQYADILVPQALLKTVLSQKSIHNLDASSIKVLKISSRAAGNLYVFDYRSSQLCGAVGYLYSLYNESGNILLEFIANPYLPPKENLIQATDIDNSRFPCLIITQSTEQENIVSRTRYCYHKGKYIRLNRYLTEVGKGLESKD